LPSGGRSSAKAALASGAQPAVFKVISAAHGRTRVAALLEYLGTRLDEHRKKFDIPIVTQSGAEVATAAARAALLDAWSADFSQNSRARDLGLFAAEIDPSATPEQVRAALNAAHAALVARNEAAPETVARVQAKRADLMEITDHPAVIALAARAAEEWSAVAAAFEAEGEYRPAAVAAAQAQALNAQLGKNSEINRSSNSKIIGRPIGIDDGAVRLIWDRAMSIKTDADLKEALSAIRGQFNEFKTELPEAQHPRLDALFGSVVELGYARLSQAILSGDGPYPAAQTAARLTKGLSTEEIIDVLADRRDRLFANEFERLFDEGISARIDTIRSNIAASREPSTLILVAEERAHQWAVYSNDLIDGGNALAAATSVSDAAIRLYVQGLALASPPDGVEQAVATLADRQRVLALYASALDDKSSPEEAAIFAAVGRKTMIEGAESLSPEQQSITRLAVLDMVEDHQSAPLVDPALARSADDIVRAVRAQTYRSALGSLAGSFDGFQRIDALTSPQRVAYLNAIADDFASLPGDNEQSVSQIRELAETYRTGVDVPSGIRAQAAALIDVAFDEFQNRAHVRGLDPDVYPIARGHGDPSISALRGMAASPADIESLISSDMATVAQRLSVAIDGLEHHSTATPEDREAAEKLRAAILLADDPRSIPGELIPAIATIVGSVRRGDIEAPEHEIERADERFGISDGTGTGNDAEASSEGLVIDKATRRGEIEPES
jgi:hypothetical protein